MIIEKLIHYTEMYKSVYPKAKFVQNKKTVRAFFALCFIALIITPSGVSARKKAFDNNIVTILPQEAKYLRFKFDDEGFRHFIYQIGPDVFLEPDGQLGIITNLENIPGSIPLQDFWYGKMSFARFVENNSIDQSSFEVEQELIFEDVLPFHYNFQIDSLGQIHTAFISNYTVYYAVRSVDGDWATQPLVNTSLWYAMMPDIYLGDDELPRIAFIGALELQGLKYLNRTGDAFPHYEGGKKSVLYAVSNEGLEGLEWTYWDITDSRLATAYSPVKFGAYNPGIYIKDGFVYAVFNGDYPGAVASRMEMIRFVEYPTTATNFSISRHDRIYEAAIRAIKFRTPTITIQNDALVFVAGTSVTGGALAFMLPHHDDPPAETQAERVKQWDSRQIEAQRRNVEIKSIQAYHDPVTNIFVAAYSYKIDLDQSEGTFTNDIFLLTVKVVDNDVIEFGYERVSDTFNQLHGYATPIITTEGLLEVFYLEDTANGWNLIISQRLTPPSADKNGQWGFALALFMVTTFIFGTIMGIKKFVKKPDVEVELLPHQINLRDEISEH